MVNEWGLGVGGAGTEESLMFFFLFFFFSSCAKPCKEQTVFTHRVLKFCCSAIVYCKLKRSVNKLEVLYCSTCSVELR
jgi:hypothetical protein